MKWQVLCVAAVCSLVACAGGRASPATDTKAIDTVRDKFSAFNQHDASALEKIYALQAVLNSPDYSNLTGNKAIADTYRKIFESIPDARDDIQVLESAGNHVYVQFVLTGHWNGAPDKPIEVRIMSAYEVKGGQIVDDATYYDRKISPPRVAASFTTRAPTWWVE
jgi:ketosteroid isomerase-like protein